MTFGGALLPTGQAGYNNDDYEYEYDENETEVSQSRFHTWEPFVLDLPSEFKTHFVTRHSMWILTYHP